MQILESVSQPYVSDERTSSAMETFRRMLNDCIWIGLEENKTSFLSLRYACYPRLKDYKTVAAYKNNAISRAAGILSSYRKLLKKKGKRIRKPHCWKPILTTCYGFKLKGGSIVLPSRMEISLNDYVLKKIQGNRIHSITVSREKVSISFSQEVQSVLCNEVFGIDTNLENVTLAGNGFTKKFGMQEIGVAKQRYREIKRHFTRNDHRIRREVHGKYGKMQVDKAQSEIHKTTARIVKLAKRSQAAIALEEMKGIRKLYRRGNGQGSNFRARLNSWAFGEFQRQIEYKAKREGLSVIYVNARNTSAKCMACGNKLFPEEYRKLTCWKCGLIIDRDENAAINIRKRGLEKLFSTRFEPIGPPVETMKGNPTTTVILVADGGQSDLPNY
jgi:putative transposase